MNTQRASLINQILFKRHPLSERIQNVIQNAETLNEKLTSLHEIKDKLLSCAHDPKTARSLSALNLEKLRQETIHHLNQLNKLKHRFSRETINIGVVGRARQGKSRLLQSLTGLTKKEIPDGNRLHCTGVRSTIYHKPDAQTYGEVYFYTEKDFLEQVIFPYYGKLQLGAAPETISEFEHTDLANTFEGSAESKAMYEHLLKYHKNLGKYRNLLSSPKRQIEQDEIREYVAQDDLEGVPCYTNYLAVREVKIYCQFPNYDIGQIALVDMPGLGDTGTGDEQRLIQTLGQDVDIILFVRMPKPAGGDHWADVDVGLYDTVQVAIPGLNLDEWAFMVLNHLDMGLNHPGAMGFDNKDNCQDFLSTIAEKHIRVSQCFITNCASKKDTAEMLEHVLNHLVRKITDLDTRYAQHCQRSLMEWHSQINIELRKAHVVLENYANKHDIFTSKFNELWEILTNELEELVKEARKERNQPDKYFEAEVNKIIQDCLTESGLPTSVSISSIEKDRNLKGSYVQAYASYLHQIRTQLSKKFLTLDSQIQYSLELKKEELSEILATRIGFEKLSASQGTRFLEDMNSLISDVYKDLKLAFSNLIDFNVTFAAIVQRNIRDFIDELHPDRNPIYLSQEPTTSKLRDLITKIDPEKYYDEEELEKRTSEELEKGIQHWWDTHPNPEIHENIINLSSKETLLLQQIIGSEKLQAELIQTELKELYQNTLDSCQKRLNNLVRESSHIRYAMVAEFSDRVLWSLNAQDNWRNFLQDDKIAAELWDELRDINIRMKEKDDWLFHVHDASQSNKEYYFDFLK